MIVLVLSVLFLSPALGLSPSEYNFVFDVDLVTLQCHLIDFVVGLFGKLTEFWTPIETGFQSRKVSFHLYTRANNDGQIDYNLQYNNDTSLQQSSFDGSKKTYFINHGFTSTGKDPWVLEMKNKILAIEDANVFCVDMKQPLSLTYTYSVCNVYKIANLSAHFIKWLSEKGNLSPSNVHLIGHSLGAHISGLTGYYVQQFPSVGKIGRITGMDPAGPLFHIIVNKKRLDKSQADFVEVIHSNGCDIPPVVGCLGLQKAIGDVDFYPNGGALQEGCIGLKAQICSHARSHELYAESIVAPQPNSNLPFKACSCSSWLAYKFHKCNENNSQCLHMGFNLNPNSEFTATEFYLFTNRKSPFDAKESDRK